MHSEKNKTWENIQQKDPAVPSTNKCQENKKIIKWEKDLKDINLMQFVDCRLNQTNQYKNTFTGIHGNFNIDWLFDD